MTGSGSVRRRQWLAARAAAAAVRAPATAAAALALAVLGTAPAMAATAARGQAPASLTAAPATVKYYIVPPPAHGAVPTLYSIAATTLGNGSLYMEIFKLNKGRLQPNGQRLANPHSVEPGWILLLPPGASGPGVHSGPLPAAAKATSRGVRRASPRRQARAAASPAAAGAGYGSGTIAEPVIGGALLVFAVAGLGLVVRRRRRAGGGNQRKPTHARAAGPDSDWVRGLAADPPGEVGAMPYPDHQNWPASDPGRPVGAPAYQGRPADSDGQDWPYPDHPAWPAGGQGRPLTPDHPSWPATDLGPPVGTAVGYGRPAGADRPGWPYPDHPSWPASDLGRPLADDDYPSWPAAEPGGGGAGPGRPPGRQGGPSPSGGAGLPQRERLGAAPAPAVHHDPNPRQPATQVPPARGRHVRVPVGYSSHQEPTDDTPQRWSAQLARTTGPIPQTYYDLAFADGRLQVVLTEAPAADQGWAGPAATNVLQLTGADTGQQGAVTWQPGDPGNTDPVRVAQRILADADEQAAEIRLEAAAQAAAIREGAEREAAQIKEQTAAEAAPIREGAEREAAEVKQRAAADATAIRETAEREAAAIRAVAQREADALRSAVNTMSAELGRVTSVLSDTLTAPGTAPRGGAPHAGMSAAAAAAPAAPPQEAEPAGDTAPAEDAGPGGYAAPGARPQRAPGRPAARPGRRPPEGPSAAPDGYASPEDSPGGRGARTAPPSALRKPPGKSGAQTRQYSAARRFAIGAAALVTFGLLLGAFNLVTYHDLSFFVFRGQGVGATPPSPLPAQPNATPSPATHHGSAGSGHKHPAGADHHPRHGKVHDQSAHGGSHG